MLQYLANYLKLIKKIIYFHVFNLHEVVDKVPFTRFNKHLQLSLFRYLRMSEYSMTNRKMTLPKTKLAKSVAKSLSIGAKTFGVAAALLLNAQNASALGLGALQVESNLDQPLSGSIELRVAEGDDLNSVTAVIASREDFESLGIDYPSYLKDFSLLVDTLGGQRSLRVTSNNVIIKEPFIHFLVRVEWSGGSFLREYTALIDPPVYAAESPNSVAIPREVGVDQSYRADTIQPTYQEPDVIVNDVVSSESSEVQPSLEYVDQGATDASYGPVESGESLSQIAQDLQGQFPDLSIYQIMKVLYDENKSSFISGNINGLIKGSILKISDLNTIRSVDVGEAKFFYTQQISDWNPQVLVGSNDDSLNVGQDNYNYEDEQSNDSSVLDTDSYDDGNFQVGASTESDDFLSSNQGSSSDGEVLALREEVLSLETSLASSALENKELSERIEILEGRLESMNRLAELSVDSPDLANIESSLAEQNLANDESLANVDEFSTESIDDFFSDTGEDLVEAGDGLIDDVTSTVDDVVDDGSSTVEDFLDDGSSLISDVESSVEDGIETVIEEPELSQEIEEVKTSVGINTPKPESFFDKVKSLVFEGGLWKIIAGLGTLLVAGAALLFMRRRRADEEFEISMLSIESNSHSVGHSASSAASASVSMSHSAADESEADKETSFLTVYSDSDAVVQADEVDPVAEADVYIAYGRDEQAEEVLLDGIVSHPDRIDIKQKLLSLYHKRQNKEGFERIAEELYAQRALLTADVWASVCDQGKEVSPENPLFDLSGDDLNAAVEVEADQPSSDLDNIQSDKQDVVVDVASDEDLNADTVDNLDHQSSDLEEVLTIDDDSEALAGSLNDDESIQLINFDDGRSEVSELDEVEIDALEFSGQAADALNETDLSASELDSEKELVLSEPSDVSTTEDEDTLEFNFDESLVNDDEVESNQDAEHSVGDVPEVSDLEIDDDYDEARTQFELAKVFVDLGDEDGARTILVELVSADDTGDDVRADSKALLDSIS